MDKDFRELNKLLRDSDYSEEDIYFDLKEELLKGLDFKIRVRKNYTHDFHKKNILGYLFKFVNIHTDNTDSFQDFNKYIDLYTGDYLEVKIEGKTFSFGVKDNNFPWEGYGEIIDLPISIKLKTEGKLRKEIEANLIDPVKKHKELIQRIDKLLAVLKNSKLLPMEELYNERKKIWGEEAQDTSFYKNKDVIFLEILYSSFPNKNLSNNQLMNHIKSIMNGRRNSCFRKIFL